MSISLNYPPIPFQNFNFLNNNFLLLFYDTNFSILEQYKSLIYFFIKFISSFIVNEIE